LLTGSFMDYVLPARPRSAGHRCHVSRRSHRRPNPLGIKGIGGESGPTGSPPAVISAIVDALRDYGIQHIEMPAHAERVWRADRGGAAPPKSRRSRTAPLPFTCRCG